MPRSSICPEFGCKTLTRGGRCQAHTKINKWGGEGSRDDRPSRHERGYDAKWVRVRAAVIARDKGLCQVCLKAGIITQAREVDHIVNKASGGGNEWSNLQALCKRCHRVKTAKEGGK